MWKVKIPLISRLAYYSEVGSMVVAFFIAIWFVTWWKALIFAFAASRVSIFFVMLFFTVLRCGGAYLGKWTTMLQVNALGKNKGGQLIVTVFVVIYLVLWPLIEFFDFPLYLAVPIWLAVTSTFGIALIPPAVLLLGASNADTVEFERKLKNAVFPLRVVSLINPASSKLVDPIHNLRLVDEADWQANVAKIVDFATVIIDVREWTEHVGQEIQILENSSNHRLVFLLVNDDLSSPVLDKRLEIYESASRLGWTKLPSNIMIGAFRYFAHVIGFTSGAEEFRQQLHNEVFIAETFYNLQKQLRDD